MLTVVYGDIHGYVEPIKKLAEMVDWRIGSKTERRRVFLGDYIDRGPESKQLIDYLIETRQPQDVFLMGNHEDMFMHNFEWYNKAMDPYHRADMKMCFFQNGGIATMRSYGWTEDHVEVSFPNEHIEFFRNLKTSYEDARRYYVHAGIDYTRPLAEQRKSDQLWIRDQFLMCGFPFEKYVVHGHTPHIRSNGQPDIRNNRCNLDTGGCFSGGSFSAAVFDDTQDKPIEIVTVPGFRN